MYETHTPIEDRFRFSAKGTFYCSKPTERIWIIIIAVSTVIVAVVWYNALFDQLRWYFENGDTYIGGKTAGTMGYIYVFSMAFIIAAVCIIIRFILHGDKYYYSADEKHFSVWSKKAHLRKTDIYYNDVKELRFSEYYLFGKHLRGYTVTISTRTLGDITFEYLFNKSISDKTPENTPFNIIIERVELFRKDAADRGR